MGDEQNFQRGDTPLADLFAEGLRHDALQRFREHHADLVLTVRRELLDDTHRSTGGGGGVQRAEHQVAGFRRFQRDFHGFKVAHFADEHDVRVFTEGGAQRGGERTGMAADFAVVDQALLVGVHEFHRVFNRDDVVGAGPVDVVDHRGQRGRFTRTGRPGDQHQPLVQGAEVADRGRQPQLFEGQDVRGNHTGHHADAVQVAEHVHAETVAGRQRIREVGVVAFAELVLVAFAHDLEDQRLDVVAVERVRVGEYHFTVDTVRDRAAAGEVHIRCLVLQHEVQKSVNVRHSKKTLLFYFKL